MKIHADDCPRIQLRDWPSECTCTAQADLAELVAAAEGLLELNVGRDLLDKALRPFREEKPK